MYTDLTEFRVHVTHATVELAESLNRPGGGWGGGGGGVD